MKELCGLMIETGRSVSLSAAFRSLSANAAAYKTDGNSKYRF